MAKRVSDLIIGSSFDATLLPSAIAGKADGAVNLIDLETNAQATATSTKVAFIRKCTSSTTGKEFIRVSNPIIKGKQQSYDQKDDAVAVAKRQTIDFTAITPVFGTEYVLFIANKENENYFMPRRRYSVVADSTITTADNLVDAFVAAINLDSNYNGVAASNAGANVLQLDGTATDFKAAHEILFEAVPADNLEVLVVVAAADPDPGCGTYALIRAYEEVYKGYKGVLNNVAFRGGIATPYTVDYESDAAATYDSVTIEHLEPFHTNSEGNVDNEIALLVAMTAASGELDSGAGVGTLLALIGTVGLDDGSWR